MLPPQTTPPGLPAPWPLYPRIDPHGPEASAAKARPALGSSHRCERERYCQQVWPEEMTTCAQLGSGYGTVCGRLASLASPSSAGLGVGWRWGAEAPQSCGCHGVEGLIPRAGWDPLGPSWEKTGTNPALPPALISFEDGTEEPWDRMHLPCDSHVNH